jgi:alkylhydroperoxidase family enzyme
MALGNANWTKGLQSMTDWIWSGNLSPAAFPNNLGRYFLHIPGIFEQQLNFSTTLIFDEPSFRNGIQVSGFLSRVHRELVISYIGQRRHCWYTMTHHAVLGFLTARKYGMSEREFGAKWSSLTDFRSRTDIFSELESAILEFAEAFITNPKAYPQERYLHLRVLLGDDNALRFAQEDILWGKLAAARKARALAIAGGLPPREVDAKSAFAAETFEDTRLQSLAEERVSAQIVELAFLCLQFVALSGVFSALNVPDEEFLSGVIEQLVPPSVIRRINELCPLGSEDLPSLIPPEVRPPIQQIQAGSVTIAPSRPKGHRLSLSSYEVRPDNDRDKGVTVGAVQVGTYGWSFGAHFPGSLVYCLMLHPELARYEAPYSLPLLFNEDEWRNGTQTAGFVSRLLKELVYQKIYRLTRSRYGLEHHTMFLFNSYLDMYGVGRPPRPPMTDAEGSRARKRAIKHAEDAVLHILNHKEAPPDVFTELEIVTLSWVELFVTKPHDAYRVEQRLRQELHVTNKKEIAARTRRLDCSPGLGESAALDRLVNHQIAELAMLTGHMDGLGRALTILQLNSEDAVQIVDGLVDSVTGGIKPVLNGKGEVTATGYYNNRPDLFSVMTSVGVTEKTFTVNELMLNSQLNEEVKRRLAVGERHINISETVGSTTAEF